jgi:hypothetical protein
MNWWMKRAGELQQSVRHGEIDKVHEYTEDETRQASVHTREDITLIVSLLDSVNNQLSAIRWSLTLVVLMGGVGVWMGLRALHYL